MPSLIARIRSSILFSAASAQAVGLVFVLIFKTIIPESALHPWMLVALQGAGAAIASYHFGAPSWWQLIHLIFGPAAFLASQLAVPPWLWLFAFLLLLLTFGRTDRSRVPLYLTNSTTGKALAELLPTHPCFVVDIGCGDGGVVRQLAKLRPDSEFVGIEHAPLTFAWARLRSRHLPNVHIRYGSIWLHPLAPYDMAYAFLSPAPMLRLWDKACAEMRPATLLTSNSFPVPDVPADSVISVNDARQSQLYLYRIPEQAFDAAPQRDAV